MQQRRLGRVAGMLLLAAVMMLTVFPMGAVLAADEVAESIASGNIVYLNGTYGDDNYNGSYEDNPVKTLQRAAELAGEGGTIYVNGTVSLQKENVELSNVTVKRKTGFTNTLIEVLDGAELQLSNVTIDGNKDINMRYTGTLVHVRSGGTVYIKDGTELCNNNKCGLYIHTASDDEPVAKAFLQGGKIYGNGTEGFRESNGNVAVEGNASFKMSAGEIYDGYGQFGGGVTVLTENASFSMSGGAIRENKSIYNGGGINNAGLTEITGGSITANSAGSSGGAISSVGSGKTILNGATISGNIAKSDGGAVYIQGNASQAGGADEECRFTMTSGSITNNQTNGIGGGIYSTVYSASTIIEIKGGTIQGNKSVRLQGKSIAISGNENDYARLQLSGSPSISPTLGDDVFLDTRSNSAIKVDVVGEFNPVQPVALYDTANWKQGETIVSYEQGLTPDVKHFVSAYGENSAYTFKIKGQNLHRAERVHVIFGEADKSEMYAQGWAFPGEAIPDSLIPTPTKTGYTLSGWKYGNNEWDLENDIVMGRMELNPMWSLKAPTVTLAAENDRTEVHAGGRVKLIATPSHELGDAIAAYQYEWYRDGTKIKGQTTGELEVSVFGGKYTVKVQAVDDKQQISEAAESNPIECFVTPHIKSDKWTTDATNHWKTCIMCTMRMEEGAHTGGTATCTSGPICTVCNTAYGEKLEHSYTNYVSDDNATCTADGTKTAICDRGCGTKDTIPDTGSVLGHDWGEWITIDSPTCTGEGTKQRECSRCYVKETENVDPNGHTWNAEYTVDQAPTCTEDGSQSIHCQNCEVTKDSVVIPATGHTYTAGEYVSDAEGHWQVCNVCKAETAHTAHGFEWIVDKEATCTEAGSKHEACTVCQYAKEAVEIPMIDHVYANEWKSDENGHWLACTACGDKDKEAEHTFEWIIDKEATADEKGSKHEECTVCHYKKDAVEIPETGKPEEPGEGTDKPSDPSDKPGTGEDTDKPSDPSDKPGTGGDTDKPTDPLDKPGTDDDTDKPSEPSGKPSKPEQPSKPSQSTGGQAQTSNNAPKTGDDSNVIIWASLLAVSAAGVGAVLVNGMRRKHRR